MKSSDGSESVGAATLTAGVLAQEDGLHHRTRTDALDLDNHLGAREEDMSLKQGLIKGGVSTFVILLILNSLDELEGAALAVLGPDIGESLGIADGTMIFITVVSTAFFVVGAVPLGYMADRMRRWPIVGWCSLIFAAMVFL